MSNTKYELVENDTIVTGDAQQDVLYRLRALRDIGDDVKAGNLGGYATAYAVSPEGESWVYPESRAYRGASVSGNATLRGGAIVAGDVHLRDNVRLDGKCRVIGSVIVEGEAVISGPVQVMNVWVTRVGSYVGTDRSQFTFRYEVRGKQFEVSLDAEKCSEPVARSLSLMAVGDQLSFCIFGERVYLAPANVMQERYLCMNQETSVVGWIVDAEHP
jgi:hypothetical protein